MQPPIREKERAAILSALGAGVVPAIGLHHIQVGRKAEVAALLSDFQRIEQGGTAIRFIVGRFGSGKSFFLNLLQTVGLERRLVVARADITTERRLSGGSGVARSLYSELMRNIATRAKPEGGAMGSIVERWVADLAQEVKAGGGSEADVETRVTERLKPLQELVSGYDFAAVIGAYYRGYAQQKPELQASAVRWLRGEYSTKTEARNDLGVRTIIDDESFYDYLKLMAGFVRLAGYQGLLVCLDELVVLSHRLNNRQARERNYEAILRIVNDCLQGSVEGLGFLFAATDDCLTDPRRGLFSYEALATRLAANRFAAGGLVDLSGPVIRLASLTQEDCFVLLHNLRRVFARGQDEEKVLPEAGIVAYLESCRKRMGSAYFQTPRETIKQFVGLLAVLEQNPGTDFKGVIEGIKTTAVATEEAVVPEKEEAASAAAPATAGASAAASPAAVPVKAPIAAAPGQDDDLASFKM